MVVGKPKEKSEYVNPKYCEKCGYILEQCECKYEDDIDALERMIKQMQTTDNIGVLNRMYERCGNALSKIFDENYRRIKQQNKDST